MPINHAMVQVGLEISVIRINISHYDCQQRPSRFSARVSFVDRLWPRFISLELKRFLINRRLAYGDLKHHPLNPVCGGIQTVCLFTAPRLMS